MNDLINREDALHAIGAEIVGVTNEGRQLLEMCQFVIKQLPSTEHKKGDWISTGLKNVCRCSKCGNYLDFDGLNAGRGDANFCPNCGSIMNKDIINE